jgi:hypothetical protein
MRKEIDPLLLRVVTQYFSGDVRVCELESAGTSLDVHVSRPTNEEWIIEAHSNHASDAVVISGRGSTRAEALSAVAASWIAQPTALGLRHFDWKAVGDVLRSVNAID